VVQVILVPDTVAVLGMGLFGRDTKGTHMLDPSLLILHWVVIPIALLAGTRVAFGKLSYLSFPATFIVAYIFLIHLRALEIYAFDVREDKYLMAVWLTPFLYLFSALCSQAVFRHSPRKIRVAFQSAALEISARDKRFASVAPVISASLILLPIVFVLDKGTSGIALFFLLSNIGESTETMFLRIGGLVSNYSGVLTIIYSYSRALIYPVYLAVLVVLRRKGLVSRFHFWLVLIAAVFYSVLTTAKAPLAIVLLGMSIASYLAGDSSGKRRILVPALILLVALLLPAVFYPLLYGFNGLEFLLVAVESLWRRVTWVPSHTSAVYFDAFTNRFEHLGPRSNRLLAWIAGVEHVPAASFIYNNYYDASIPGGLVNASYFASFYADWGMPGVIIGTMVVGVLTVLLQVYFDRQVDAVGTGVRAATLVAMCQLLLTNFYSASLGRGFLSLPLLLVLGTAILREVYRLYGKSGRRRSAREYKESLA